MQLDRSVIDQPKICQQIKLPQQLQMQMSLSQSCQRIALIGAVFFGGVCVIGSQYNIVPRSVVWASGAVSLILLFLLKDFSNIKKQSNKHILDEDCTSITNNTNILDENFTLIANNNHSYGFRFVGSYDDASREKEKGFKGDSLNLDLTSPATWKSFMPNDPPNCNGWTKLDQLRLGWSNRLAVDEKKELIKKWENGVEDFLNKTLNYFGADKSAYFLLIDYSGNNKYSYDTDQYGKGLGKKGKKTIQADQVVAIIHPPKESLDDNALVHYYRSALIREIRNQG